MKVNSVIMKVKSKKKKKKKDKEKERKPEKRNRRSKILFTLSCVRIYFYLSSKIPEPICNNCSPKMEKEKSRKKRKSNHDRSEKVFTLIF